MPIISGRSKLVCYFTLYRKSKLKQDGSSSTIELFQCSLPDSVIADHCSLTSLLTNRAWDEILHTVWDWLRTRLPAYHRHIIHKMYLFPHNAPCFLVPNISSLFHVIMTAVWGSVFYGVCLSRLIWTPLKLVPPGTNFSKIFGPTLKNLFPL